MRVSRCLLGGKWNSLAKGWDTTSFHKKIKLIRQCIIDRSVHNTKVSCRFICRLYRTHFGYTEKYIKFRPVNAYMPKLDNHFPLYFSYLDIKFVPHYQDLIPFFPLLFLCLFSNFFKFPTLHVSSAMHYCIFSMSLSRSLSLMFSFPFFYYFF